MKRSLAIQGPTPAFVRWSIDEPCPFRRLEDAESPDGAFRLLRGVREWAIAEAEGRVHDGLAFHPQALAVSPDQALGFIVAEVLEAFGGSDNVGATCGDCPANVASVCVGQASAGCFGFLPSQPFDLERRLSGYPTNEADGDSLPEQLQRVAEEAGLLEELAVPLGRHVHRSVWHAVFRRPVWQPEDLDWLLPLTSRLTLPRFPGWRRFQAAVAAGAQSGRVLQVELIPSGEAIGQTWRLNWACPECRWEPAGHPERIRQCEVCHRQGGLPEPRSYKVLGIRPYTPLIRLLGLTEATRRLEAYRAMRER